MGSAQSRQLYRQDRTGLPKNRKSRSSREDGSHGKRTAKTAPAGHDARAGKHARCGWRCCCRSACRRREKWHRGFCQSGDARWADQDRRAHRRRGQIAEAHCGHRHGDSPDLRRHRAILRTRKTDRPQSRSGRESRAAQTPRSRIQRHDRRRFRRPRRSPRPRRFPRRRRRNRRALEVNIFFVRTQHAAPPHSKTSPMELIDSHAHIDFPQFAEDRDAMLARARAAGVSTLLAIGTGPGPEKLDSALPFAEQHDWIYATVGIHPHEAKEVTPQRLEELTRLAQHPKVIAWGEIGLDYYYDHSPREAQARVFRDQIALARRAKKPIIIHCRDAWTDCLNIIEEHWRPTGLGGILHCFTSTLEDARRGIEMGFLISFAGNSTYPKTQNLRDVAKALPLENILIETDAPYLAPQPYRGKRNEPAYVAEVARTLATVRDLTPDEVAATTTGNFRRFFGLARPASLAASGLKADE